MSGTGPEDLKKTPLDKLHRELGARMVPFAGWSMPVQFRGGIIAEHLHTRAEAGLFDVSHMGQVRLSGPDFATAAAALESVTPGDFVGLKPGRMRYSMLLTAEGTIIDDAMVARLPGSIGDTGLNIVFNAARVAGDIDFVRSKLSNDVKLEVPPERAMLALQGPGAADVLARHAAIDGLSFMDIAAIKLDDADCLISRSGYTGEDGFEIYLDAADADRVARSLLDEAEVMPVGLGARDSLRLEAGLTLYGHDIDETTTPVEADLGFAIAKRRRLSGDFPGASRILDELIDGPARRRVGLALDGRLPAREGAPISRESGGAIGVVTSGGFSPSLGTPIAMGYAEADQVSIGSRVGVEVRGRVLTATVTALPFVAHRYYRRNPK
ncbi:MAG: glycine cleavage system aminomethyltransferase GcvT [Alphaproteobacteria bacterium]